MTLDRSGSNYPIQSNGSVLGHSSHISKRQGFQPRGEAQMEYSRASKSSQRLCRTFETLIESSEAFIAAIPVVISKQVSTRRSGDIPVLVQELAYGSKVAGVGDYVKSMDRDNELISSSEQAPRPIRDRGSSERLDSTFYQRASITDKTLLEEPKHVI
ncbi:hypothetical protein O181_035431 [Austropuccinia psidii MF-1]|uniref:Uncharacterized protein n=1 Tax=Austropuccinia psidii MF-1 TaxID=1389203 RepID=A0A9Q3H8Y4_9BASI|nr:hypothetical protein [Austropuccinia psidii MF-1]